MSTTEPAESADDGRRETPNPRSLVEVRNVTVYYPKKAGLLGADATTVRAVDGVSFLIANGMTLGLVGESGSGKSTIARLLFRMVRPTSGQVLVKGRDLARLRGRDLSIHSRLVQMVAQDPYSSLDPRLTVGRIISEPISLGNLVKDRSAEVRHRVSELLRVVGLPPSSADAHPHQFSGGQRQRIAIARALAARPELILLDEPTSALDISVRAQILNLLKDLQKNFGVTYLLVSHDLSTVAYLATTVAVMYLGRIVEMGPTEAVYAAPTNPYTWLLLASVPNEKTDFASAELTRAGEIPTGEIPVGCRFHPRCPLRKRLLYDEALRCKQEDPPLREVGPNHWSACHFAEQAGSLARVQ